MATQRQDRNGRVLISPLAVDEPRTPPPAEKSQKTLEKTGTAAVLVLLLVSILLLLLSRLGVRF